MTFMDDRPSVDRRMLPGEPKMTRFESAGDTAFGPFPVCITGLKGQRLKRSYTFVDDSTIGRFTAFWLNRRVFPLN